MYTDGLLHQCEPQATSDYRHLTRISFYGCDDVLCYDKGSKEAHLDLITLIVSRFEEDEAQIKMAKVKLARSCIPFLGLDLSSHGWPISLKFLDSVRYTPLQTSLRELRAFVGLSTGKGQF